MSKKWLINLSEDPHTRNATFDTGRSLKKILIWHWFVLCVFTFLGSPGSCIHLPRSEKKGEGYLENYLLVWLFLNKGQ